MSSVNENSVINDRFQYQIGFLKGRSLWVVRICQNSFGELRRLLKLSNAGQRDHKPIRVQIIHQQNKGSFFIYLFICNMLDKST